ncbi:MAG: bifunctional 5,10-methylene-tetrahydrofolate dehydrogenase/5,10-methylene-tetrahydrofolate cyclohydrolase [candidate division Zixibacteria bacterium RBG_19FT_COMBO_42_43]|nr:MAG: bifunctional 5,10-methylene-tetrahydrofolate dehydrogenase/5,10-methylene-tetrahydrofolate cyclohydrolase [candidate division Zixibacteria bacterium RBG_19FT_COMBO_42_43]
MAKIIDGKKIAEDIKNELKSRVEALKQQGVIPYLVAIIVGDNPASVIYVRNKAKACKDLGIISEIIQLPQSTTEEELTLKVLALNQKKEVHGILVQSPLPGHIDHFRIFATVDINKDVDGFHPYNLGMLFSGRPRFIPCTPLGIQELLLRSGNDPAGKHVVILGRGNIVGKPLAALLVQKAKGADATVTLCHRGTNNLPEITKTGDILVAAIGNANFVAAEMVKPGAAVVDVGVNSVIDVATGKKKLVGDVEFDSVSKVASAITPVPGGVGPMTIALLLHNTLKAAEIQNRIKD